MHLRRNTRRHHRPPTCDGVEDCDARQRHRFGEHADDEKLVFDVADLDVEKRLERDLAARFADLAGATDAQNRFLLSRLREQDSARMVAA